MTPDEMRHLWRDFRGDVREDIDAAVGPVHDRLTAVETHLRTLNGRTSKAEVAVAALSERMTGMVTACELKHAAEDVSVGGAVGKIGLRHPVLFVGAAAAAAVVYLLLVRFL